MRTPLIAATAAALSALAVTVAGAAYGDGAHRSQGGDTRTAALRVCLTTHGATVPAGDARVLKPWLAGDRTAAEKDAISACGLALPQKNVVKDTAGPDEATIRSCLADHGVTVPAGDGATLKRWIVGDRTSAEKDALTACGMAPPGIAPMIRGGAPCATGKPGPGAAAKPDAGPR
jgi:hypothetical protein